MAFDPVQEDCLRLTLEAMRRERVYPLENPAFVERCMDAFRHDPARLIVHDRDRSFHLVAQATEALDYRAPFIQDESELEEVTRIAEDQLREAVQLDEHNWDAQRMLAAITSETNDDYVSYLLDNRAAVEEDLKRLQTGARDAYDREYANDLGGRAYLRWLAALASRAVVAGQYRLALRTAEESLALAPYDPADVRHTAVLTLAKLECTREELDDFRVRHATSYQPPAPSRRRHRTGDKPRDAWSLIAEVAIAYHELDFAGAQRALRTLMRAYPRAAEPLYFQAEFPDGVFARVNVIPGSEDELILALSEATPLLQEGVGAPDNACLAAWIALSDPVQEALGEQPVQPSFVHHPGGGDN